MRTLDQSIKEVRRYEKRRNVLSAAIVVAFTTSWEVVRADDGDPKGALREKYIRGGDPVGLISVAKSGTVTTRPFKELSNLAWAKRFLRYAALKTKSNIAELRRAKRELGGDENTFAC